VVHIIHTPFPALSHFWPKKENIAVTFGVTCIFFTNNLYKWSSILDIYGHNGSLIYHNR